MAAKTSWRRYGTKLRHGHPMHIFESSACKNIFELGVSPAQSSDGSSAVTDGPARRSTPTVLPQDPLLPTGLASSPPNPSLLAPQIRLLQTIVRSYKLYLLTYLRQLKAYQLLRTSVTKIQSANR